MTPLSSRPLRDPELDRLSDWDDDHGLRRHHDDLSGNEADADDTSIDSRTSSRIMGESVDSLGHMYDSEYDVDFDHRDLKLLPSGDGGGGDDDLGGLNDVAAAAAATAAAGEESDFFQDDEDKDKKRTEDASQLEQGNPSSPATAAAKVRELKC